MTALYLTSRSKKEHPCISVQLSASICVKKVDGREEREEREERDGRERRERRDGREERERRERRARRRVAGSRRPSMSWSASPVLIPLVFDYPPLYHHEDHIFADAGGKVPQTFKVSGCIEETHRALDG
ncbi:hypothetical protein [Syntrophorhabdus aromaticivorans]|uniref:hypothetical protein n=1 Tax=Syntrophorhabdus aromaticivorans TaxID=328301 RepID=UPI00048E40DC|nr:hypothetical protein [Syntrophorhabdus aromaticivorans]